MAVFTDRRARRSPAGHHARAAAESGAPIEDVEAQVVLLGTEREIRHQAVGSGHRHRRQWRRVSGGLAAGVMRRAQGAYEKGVLALEPRKIRVAFLTHLHQDHTTGYADLIYSPRESRCGGFILCQPPAYTRSSSTGFKSRRFD